MEWWGRSNYKSVEAHRDVDEEAASTRGERRYPTHSLLVYLDIDEGIRAPTCLWVPTTDPDGDDNEKKSALVVVPMVPGRLLVFSGELLHAVPCPALRWLDPISNIRDDDSGYMRRVLVLNLWDDYAPKDEEWLYDEDDDWDDAEEGEEEDDAESPIEFFAKRVECQPRQRWQPIGLQGPLPINDETSTPSSHLPAATITMSTRSHGSDEPLLSPLKTTHSTIAQILESKSIPHWLWTGADVRDLGIGVPSVAGSREERMTD